MGEPKPKKPNQFKPAQAATSGNPGAGAVPLSAGRKWLFSLVGFVLLPLLLLAGVELALRLSGYGYSTAFFKRIRIGTEDYLVENDKFGLRFFPPELSRSPPPVVMKANKDPRVLRIFLFGESAALGDPRPSYGAGRYLQVLLRERFPEARFEVICGAVAAINSHAVLPIARECARRQGNLWIIYMGNNEMVGPYGATTVVGAQSPPLWHVRLSLAVQETRLGQLLLGLGRALAGAARHGPSWGGQQMFMENRIAPQDPRKEAVYHSFRKNLEEILEAGAGAGVPVILSTVAVNLKDSAPFGSLLKTGLTPDERQVHANLCAQAARDQEAGNFRAAAGKFEQAAGIDPHWAELEYRWGECLLSQQSTAHEPKPEGRGSTAETPSPYSSARDHFERARDDDALPFRADSRLNAIITQVGRQHAGPRLALCDAASLFASNSPAGVPGREVFYEHVHFNFDGNYLLARAWAEEVSRLLPAGATNHASVAWASQEACEQRLGLTDWNRYAIFEDLLQRLSQAPFTGQLEHTQAVEWIRDELRSLRRGLDRPNAAKARETCLAALRLAPQDHRLHENFAQFLEAVGDLPQAASEWQRVRELIPQHHAAYFQEGRLLERQGGLEAGRRLLLQAVSLRPDLAEGWLELGNIHEMEHRPDLALKEYKRLLQLAPHDCRAHYRIGKALSNLNRRPEAIESLRQAVRLRPDYWEAHCALGEELALSGLAKEARMEFEETIRLDPENQQARDYLAKLGASRR
jgi:tetratricopeptide (TPR) repeat protein